MLPSDFNKSATGLEGLVVEFIASAVWPAAAACQGDSPNANPANITAANNRLKARWNCVIRFGFMCNSPG